MVPEALVFDFDGTLVDTETAEYESVRRVWEDHGHEYSLAQWTPYVGTVDHVPWTQELEERLGMPVDHDGLRVQARRINRDLLHLVRPRPGVAELLAAANGAGVPIGIASNAPAGWVEAHLERLGLLQHFAHVVTVDRVERPKPHPEMYLTAVQRLGASPERSVAFEDSATGLAAARAAGLYTIAVPGPMSDGHNLTGADRLHRSLAECTLHDLGHAVEDRATARRKARSSLGR